MRKFRRILAALAVSSAILGATAAPVFADPGGAPNENSCGGIGREARDFAATPGPMDPQALFEAQGPFTCDDVGEEHGQGF